ncbi:13473_t:CDS:2 [Acaulospora colombiana]|uniref:13473_t:CDS:1 n=1 Tax=Acaulospora colombiana TaxID=27376 RepID=A0ACA9KXD2_9GLOM|nr:13473_t:CDS:2 [Acaulospora colombiana]
MALFLRKLLDIFNPPKGDEGSVSIPHELEKNYRILRVIGTGSFAIVRECVDKKTGQSYALKVISKRSVKGKEQMLSTECEILKKIHHPYIVTLHGLYETKEGVFIVTDLARGGELFDQLIKKGSYTERDAANLVRQMLRGVSYLHENGIVHRDLKPENLLFKDKSEDADILITDFGLSKILKNKNDILTTACGTPGYVAPEVLSQHGHGKPVDIWSIGVIMYTMLCGYQPFYGDDQNALFESIMRGQYDYEEDYWAGISVHATDLIDKMLTLDPSKRITAQEALQHQWFQSATTVDILGTVRNNLSAKDKFRRAIHLIKDVNRFRNLGSQRNLDVESKIIEQERIQVDDESKVVEQERVQVDGEVTEN